MSTTSLPDIPLELQDEILELAARESPEVAVTLVQVSRRCLNRIEPILYEIVVIEQSTINSPFSYPPHLQNRSPDLSSFFKRYGHHIRYLSIDLFKEKSVIQALDHCPSLLNLNCPIDYTLDIISTLQRACPPLTRLSGKLEDCWKALDASNQVYESLTHLDLIGWYLWTELSPFLSQLPHLTHLALDDPRDTDCPMISGALQGCRKLKALLLVTESGLMKDDEACQEVLRDDKNTNGTGIDGRIVVVLVKPLDSWLNGVRGDLDMWILADQVISERRRGKRERDHA